MDERVSYYEDGKTVKRIEHFKDGKPYGCFYEFFQNGDTALIECFRDGELHGYSYHFHENGTTKSVSLFHEGDFVFRKSYYENGTLSLETHYKGNNLHGPYLEGYENGQIKTQGQYYERIPTNTWSFYDSLGFKYKEIIYADSNDIEIRGTVVLINGTIGFPKSDTLIYLNGDTILRPSKPDEVIITIED